MGEPSVARMNTHILVLLVSLACFCSRTDSINCYQCDTSEYAECDDPFDGDMRYLLECDTENENDYFCRKITQTVEGTKKVIRSCAHIPNMDHSNDSCYESQDSGYSKSVCVCPYDECNSAALSTVSLLLAMTSCLLISQLS